VSAWAVSSVAIASVLALPSLVVLLSLGEPAYDVWAHLWRTQLLELIGNTLALLAGVGAGTLVVGAGLAWLVVAYRFPGRGVLEWALVLPLAIPAYVIGFAFLGLFDFAGPVQSALRRSARRPPVRHPLVLGRRGPDDLGLLSLRLPPRPRRLSRAGRRYARDGSHARPLAHARVLPADLADGRPSLAAGVSLAMMEALADFGTVATFGYRTLTEGVYRVWYGMFDRAAATQLASLLLLFALSLLMLERSLRGRARFTQSQRRGQGVIPQPLTGWRGLAASAIGFAILGFAFVSRSRSCSSGCAM
jgi:iron(III) transport system permease protein